MKRIILMFFIVMLVGCTIQGEAFFNNGDSNSEKEVATKKENNDESTVKLKSNNDHAYRDLTLKDIKEKVKLDKKENKEETNKEEVEKKKPKEEPKNEKKKEKVKVEKEKEKVKSDKPKFKTEKITGEYMSTVELNIRKGPSLDHKSIGILAPYKKAEAIEKTTYNGVEWYKISYNGNTGWSSASYLKPYKKDSQPKTQSSKSTKNSSYKPMHIYYNGRAVPYKNVGMADNSNGEQGKAQAVIDNTNYASTWGGQATFNGFSDNHTHFIGHSNKQFINSHQASSFIVTDSKGNAFEYVKTSRYVINEYAVDVNSGANKWDRITGSGGGNRISVQNTKSHPQKWIVEAKFNRQIK